VTTNETTARYRAIQVVEDALAQLAERIVPDEVAAVALVDALLANPEVLRALAGAPADEDRRALDAIAELCGARPGDHRDNVVMLVRSMLQDPTIHNARRARALAVVDRLVSALQNLIDDSSDPGPEALGAVWEGRSFLRQGGGAMAPVGAWSPIPPARVQVWQQEGRSPLWQALVHRLHGDDAVDNHGLSIADAERLADAALDEIGRHDGASTYPAEYGHPKAVLPEQMGGPPNERYPDPAAPEIADAELAEAERALRVTLAGPGRPALWWQKALPIVLAEYDRRGDELAVLSLLRHYLGTIANRIGRPTRSLLRQVSYIEEVGEGVLAELERLRARVARLEPIEQRAREVLASWERDYVSALNAILAAYDDNSADADRWRGHAEAYRQVCEHLRRDLGWEPAAYTSAEWRHAHGVYTDEQVAEFRRFTINGGG
jgi:hypothetical protein